MRMGEDCRHLVEAGADLFHLDVMDGHFVPNLTMGPDMCRGLRRELPEAFLDVHLMVSEPGKFVDAFIEAGANHLTFHVEVMGPAEAVDLARQVRSKGVTVGLAVNPPTPVDRVMALVGEFDLFLVMSVNPGFSGQKFIAPVLEKTRALREVLKPGQRLEMDGGIGLSNIGEVREAGCDVVVAATAIFGVPRGERAGVMGAMRQEK
jgi:ribulose-phosphate 3-epimerase